MDFLLEEITRGIPDAKFFALVVVRLLASALFGAMIGFQREVVGKPAGLRTHILVSMGTTVFVLACVGFAMDSDGLSRVIQGIVTGIGFIGAGSILKLDKERDIKGLTTAASVWAASAVGVAVGLGSIGLGLISTILTLMVLSLVHRVEIRIASRNEEGSEDQTI